MQSIGRLRRKPIVPKIGRVGRYYTRQDLVSRNPPRSWKFNTKRKAKKFFSLPLIMKNARQFELIGPISLNMGTETGRTSANVENKSNTPRHARGMFSPIFHVDTLGLYPQKDENAS